MTISANFPNVQPSLLLDFANAKQLPPSATFTRATPAAYYDGHTTALAEQNLFNPSVNIGSPYQNNANTLTNNTGTAPDGTATASLLVPNNTSTRHYCTFGSYGPAGAAGTTYTVSVYAKPSGYDYIFVQFSGTVSSGGPRYGVTFNITSGAIEAGGFSFTSNVTSTSAAITSAGNGWYRVSLTLTSTLAPSNPVIYVQSMPLNGSTYASGGDGLPSYAGNGTNGAYFWGGQLEQRSSVTAYTATTTQPVTNYVPVLLTAGGGQPRFDHNPTTSESLGLLIEDQRTNLMLNSSAIQNWAASSVAINANTIIAPDGTLSGEKIIASSNNTYHYIGQTISIVNGTTYAFSAYLKQGQNRYATLLTNSAGTFLAIGIDMQAGTIVTNSVGVTQATGTIQSVGNGWYRATMLMTATSTSAEFRIACSNSTNTSWTFTGDDFSGFYAWGGQVEAGLQSTSYIPTVAAAVTRPADTLSFTGANFSSWYNASEGTFYADATSSMDFTNSSNRADLLNVSQGAGQDNAMFFGPNAVGGTNVLYLYTLTSGAEQASILVSLGGLSTFRAGFVYKLNDFAELFNGGAAGTDTLASTSYLVNQITIGCRYNGTQCLNGTYKKLAYYPVRVTNAQLQALTS